MFHLLRLLRPVFIVLPFLSIIIYLSDHCERIYSKERILSFKGFKGQQKRKISNYGTGSRKERFSNKDT